MTPELLAVAGLAKLAEYTEAIATDAVKGWVVSHNPTTRLRKAWSEEREAMLFEMLAALKEQSKLLESVIAADASKAATLQALVSDRQFGRLHVNYELEGVRETMDERRDMLACAQAGSFNLDLSLAQIARTERVLRELDPDAVHLLHEMLRDADRDKIQDFDLRTYETRDHFYALLSSGCIRINTEQNGLKTIKQERSIARVMRRDPGERPEGDPRDIQIPNMDQFGYVNPVGRHVITVLGQYFVRHPRK